MSTPLLALLALIAPGNPPALADAPFARHSQPAPVELVVDAKNGETLHGVKKFKVIVQTDEVVTQVEFYVNGELRTSEQSTPYRFELDTLNENDGDLAIKFIAYTDQTHKGTKEFKFTVDNGVAKGADFHVKAGAALLADGKLDEAVTEGRIALKADKTSAAARLLLARAFLFGNVLDKAQKYADDVVADDKNNLEALELSSVIGLKQAFTTAAKSLDDSETLKTVKDVLKTAVEARQRYLDGAVEKLGAGASLLAVADANTRAGHYTTAINLLTPEFGKDHTRLEVANRLIYAQIKRGRFNDALGTITLLKKAMPSVSDPYTLALIALVAAQVDDTTKSDAAIQDGLLADNNSLAIRTAQASISLRNATVAGSNKNFTALQNMMGSLAKDAGHRTEINYLLSALANRVNQFAAARSYFETSVLEEPCNYDMYIEAGNSSISQAQSLFRYDAKGKEIKDADREKRQKFLYGQAETMFATALIAKPDSYQALTGLGLTYLIEGKRAEALKYTEAAAKTEPTYAAGLYAFAAALSAVGRDDDAKTMCVASYKYDATLDGQEIPKPLQAWRYFNSRGRSPIITPPGS